MAYPITTATTALTELQSIDALAEAEAGILSCMSDLLYQPDTTTATLDPLPLTLFFNIKALLDDTTVETIKVADILKQILCGYACKEATIADLVNALACNLALENGLLPEDDGVKCEDCCSIE